MTAATLTRAATGTHDVPLGSRLTEREFEILRLVALGDSNGEIAQRLFLSRNTVNSHMRRILGRLGARSRAHAVALAFQRRILLPPGERRRPPLPDFTQAAGPVGASVVEQALLVRSWTVSGRALAVREAAGLSRAQVAAACGASSSTVVHWEAGQRPHARFLEAYYRALREMAAAADAQPQNGSQSLAGAVRASGATHGPEGAPVATQETAPAIPGGSAADPRGPHSPAEAPRASRTRNPSRSHRRSATGLSAGRPDAPEAQIEESTTL